MAERTPPGRWLAQGPHGGVAERTVAVRPQAAGGCMCALPSPTPPPDSSCACRPARCGAASGACSAARAPAPVRLGPWQPPPPSWPWAVTWSWSTAVAAGRWGWVEERRCGAAGLQGGAGLGAPGPPHTLWSFWSPRLPATTDSGVRRASLPWKSHLSTQKYFYSP